MARWKLRQPHYLRIPGNFWEQVEMSPAGKQVRKQYPVPAFFHHDDPTQWNYITERDMAGRPVSGDIVVCHEGKGDPKDIVFIGPCTPDMEPLDDEAKALSAKLKVHASFEDDAPEGGFAGQVLQTLSEQMAQAMANAHPQTVHSPQMDELLKAITAMMGQNQQILNALVAPALAKTQEAGAARRV